MTSKVQTAAAKPKPPNAGKGRPKGVPNKNTAALKDAILLAAETVGEDGEGKAGLVGYLCTLARIEPKSFASLLGRVLPLQVTGEGGGALVVRVEQLTTTGEQKAVWTKPSA